MAIDQRYFRKIITLVAPGSRVLDLGCGDGQLLELLAKTKQVQGYGIEIDSEAVAACVRHGISVFQGNIDAGLAGISDRTYDYVILSQTLQQVRKPQYVLSEMLRVGRRAIVTFPNFANWKSRLQILFGKAPSTRSLPYQWYDTPNIRVITIADFKAMCAKEGIRIAAEIPVFHHPLFLGRVPRRWGNLIADEAIFLLEKTPTPA
jgi:methionine biosynthesis protein MetW